MIPIVALALFAFGSTGRAPPGGVLKDVDRKRGRNKKQKEKT